MNEKRIRFFQMIGQLTVQAKAAGIAIMPTAFYRTAEQQAKLFAEGKSRCDGVIKKSKHQSWLAMDFVIMRDGGPVWQDVPEYETLGGIWNELGGIWGGYWMEFKDIFHFEL